MPEEIKEPFEEPMNFDQLTSKINDYVDTIASALLKNAQERDYSMDVVQATLDYLYGKTELFCKGLLPSDDYSFLGGELDHWFGMATSVRDLNDVETSDRIVRHAVDAIQGVMFVNRMLGKESMSELLQKWPIENAPAA